MVCLFSTSRRQVESAGEVIYCRVVSSADSGRLLALGLSPWWWRFRELPVERSHVVQSRRAREENIFMSLVARTHGDTIGREEINRVSWVVVLNILAGIAHTTVIPAPHPNKLSVFWPASLTPALLKPNLSRAQPITGDYIRIAVRLPPCEFARPARRIASLCTSCQILHLLLCLPRLHGRGTQAEASTAMVCISGCGART